MTNTLKVDIQQTGFPVRIGSVELFFDSSLENLVRFINIEKLVQEKLKEAREKAQHIHLPDDANIEDLDSKTIDTALDLNKEYIAAQYDIIFGDGTFKKVYEAHPDILALEKAIDIVGVSIAKEIEMQEEERGKQVEEMQNEALKKIADKRQ